MMYNFKIFTNKKEIISIKLTDISAESKIKLLKLQGFSDKGIINAESCEEAVSIWGANNKAKKSSAYKIFDSFRWVGGFAVFFVALGAFLASEYLLGTSLLVLSIFMLPKACEMFLAKVFPKDI